MTSLLLWGREADPPHVGCLLTLFLCFLYFLYPKSIKGRCSAPCPCAWAGGQWGWGSRGTKRRCGAWHNSRSGERLPFSCPGTSERGPERTSAAGGAGGAGGSALLLPTGSSSLSGSRAFRRLVSFCRHLGLRFPYSECRRCHPPPSATAWGRERGRAGRERGRTAAERSGPSVGSGRLRGGQCRGGPAGTAPRGGLRPWPGRGEAAEPRRPLPPRAVGRRGIRSVCSLPGPRCPYRRWQQPGGPRCRLMSEHPVCGTIG